jgi:opacity protein-like surface antigen
MKVAIGVAFIGLSCLGPAAAQQFSGVTTTIGIGGVLGQISQQSGVFPKSDPPPLPPPPPPPPDDDCEVECGDGRARARGLMGGLGLGYNWQSGAFIYGLGADFYMGKASGSASDCGTPVHECGGAIRSLGTVRGLVGWSMGNWMPYVTGGYAYGDVQAYDSFYGGSGSHYLSGWTIGGGIEAVIAGPWSAKLEYLYIDLGKSHHYDIVPGVPEFVDVSASVIRLGLNYRFPARP